MAITSNGTTFSYAGGAVADVISISAPTVSTATIDTTNMEAIHRTFIAGTIDSGTMSLEIMYDPNSDTDIEDAWDNTAVAAPVFKTCIITFSDSATFTFDAILVGFSASVSIDDKVTASIELKITGAVTVAAS